MAMASGATLAPSATGLMAVAIHVPLESEQAWRCLSSSELHTREIDDRVMCRCVVGRGVGEGKLQREADIVACAAGDSNGLLHPCKTVVAHVENYFPPGVGAGAVQICWPDRCGLVIGFKVHPSRSAWSSPSSWCQSPFWLRPTSPGRTENYPLLKFAVLFNPIVYMSEGLRAL